MTCRTNLTGKPVTIMWIQLTKQYSKQQYDTSYDMLMMSTWQDAGMAQAAEGHRTLKVMHAEAALAAVRPVHQQKFTRSRAHKPGQAHDKRTLRSEHTECLHLTSFM